MKVKPKLTLELMMFVQAVLADPGRNLTRAYESVFGDDFAPNVAKNLACRAWGSEPVKAYVAYLQEKAASKEPPEKHVHVEVEGGAQLAIKPHGKLLEAAELTQRELENLIVLHLTHGPTDLLDENLEVKPEFSHLVDSFKVTVTIDKEGNPRKTVEIKVPSREGLMKMLWTCRGFQPSKAVGSDDVWRRLRESQEAKIAIDPRLAML